MCSMHALSMQMEQQLLAQDRKPAGVLNALENTVARFYLAPCLFLQMYNNCLTVIRTGYAAAPLERVSVWFIDQ